MTKKILFWLWFLLFSFFSSFLVSADHYTLFYGNGCPHCQKVEKFFDANAIDKTFSVERKEIYFNRSNLSEFNSYIQKLNLSGEIWVPILVIEWSSGSSCTYLAWSESIVRFFSERLDSLVSWVCDLDSCDHLSCNHQNCTHENCDKQWAIISSEDSASKKALLGQRLSFLAIMLPAAISDSINPCAFAVMLLLLSSILSNHKSRRRTLLAWWLFSLAVFLSYLAMGIWLFSALANSTNTFLLKLVVWILWILVWLANLKDYFWYGKWFVMEVPLSWRPKMQDLIYKVSSPIWAFFVWILVSLFLLPCSSGPYFTILGYLSSQSKDLTSWWYLYLIIYNLIFVLPMFVIAILVSFGYSSVDKIAKIKHQNTKLIHLVVWILMLGLGVYVLTTL
jgi:cytochrome c biogenesis protein CcdA/glutaredoxin